jgi:hypothetical protein
MMLDFTEDERKEIEEMLDWNLAPETIVGLIQRRRALANHREKEAVWSNFKRLLNEVLRVREIERDRHFETDPVRAARRQSRSSW